MCFAGKKGHAKMVGTKERMVMENHMVVSACKPRPTHSNYSIISKALTATSRGIWTFFIVHSEACSVFVWLFSFGSLRGVVSQGGYENNAQAYWRENA